jgi:hypothetical protein
MNNDQKSASIELYQAYTVSEILERRELLGSSSSIDSMSGGISFKS